MALSPNIERYRVYEWRDRELCPKLLDVYGGEDVSINESISRAGGTIPDSAYTEERIASKRLHKKKMRTIRTSLGVMTIRAHSLNHPLQQKLELERASLLSEWAYHSPDVYTDNPIFLQLSSNMDEGFPMFIQCESDKGPQATIWLFQDTGDLYVALRGNYDLDMFYSNLISNPSVVQSSTHLPLHPWFVNDYDGIAPSLHAVIKKSINSIQRVILTGHGLGGALATVAAPALAVHFRELPFACITLGSTMVGGAEFKRWFRQHIQCSVRLVTSSDPAAYLPSNRIDYEHPVDALCITRRGSTSIWPAAYRASPKLRLGIGNVDFDSRNWQQNARMYRRRVYNAIHLQGRLSKEEFPARGPRVTGA